MIRRRRAWPTEPENHEYAALGLPAAPMLFFPIFSIKEDVYR